jgi:hypothetical protein
MSGTRDGAEGRSVFFIAFVFSVIRPLERKFSDERVFDHRLSIPSL